MTTDFLTHAHLIAAAADIKGEVLEKMIFLKLQKAFRQTPTPELIEALKSFANGLRATAEDIEERLESFS